MCIQNYSIFLHCFAGVPDFVEQMYSAARYLHKHGKTYHETDGQKNHDQVPL